jgi:fatty acid desaturase
VPLEQQDSDSRAPMRLSFQVMNLACHANPLCSADDAIGAMKDLRNLLSREQWDTLQRKSALRAAWALCVNWGLVVTAFAIAIAWPSALGVLVAMVVLGGRQLGLGILMHDCAHRGLLPSSKANDWVGQWLCAAPVFADLDIYRRYHMTHHRHAGTEQDPDLPNYRGYPVPPASFARKLLRDLVALTGLRAALALAMLYSHADPNADPFGYSYRREPGKKRAQQSLRQLLWNLRRVLLVQSIGFAVLWALGHPLAYLLWPASWLTSYMLFSRIRNAAEHAGLPGTMSTNPWLNTRSVKAGWLARLTVAPNHVNWHFEHHLAPAVPGYRLPALHRMLARQDLPNPLPLWAGYGAVVRSLVQR